MATSDYCPVLQPQWFVLRDLKRPNSNTPAYKVLTEMGLDVFTPMQWVMKVTTRGKKERRYVPIIPSLLFVRSVKEDLDPIVDKTVTLQYRFVKGAPQNTPMTVPAKEMEIFINAVKNSPGITYYTPSEITPDMIGRKVMVVGGELEGVTGKLLKMRGSKKKRLVISIEGLISAVLEVEKDYIRII
ncbi:MAG: UpxY family transcription antiterminator [Bacteroides sp.]|nr:UpxY family transcription antiterminator [Bacteroides sp.]